MTAVPAAPAPVPASTARPKLPGKQRAAASIAGILGFLLCTVGWTGIAIALGFLVLGSMIAGLVASAAGSGVDTSKLTDQLNAGAILLPLLVVGVVGLVIWLLGVLISRGILKASGHPKPGAVTFTGLLIAIVLSFILSAIAGVVFSAIVGTQVNGALGVLASSSSDLTSAAGAESALGSAFNGILPTMVVFGVIQLVIVVVVGWLSWLWMAIAFRAKAVAPAI